jgi:hypothetical protein
VYILGFLIPKFSTTSPSGRHLGLYKSLVTAHCDSGGEFDGASDKYSLSTKRKATLILQAIHRLAITVAERGLYLTRWIYVINVMIYKKIGVLRVIHLFEADFNLLVGLIFGRRTVHNAVDSNRIHPSQFEKKAGNAWTLLLPRSSTTRLPPFPKPPWGNLEVMLRHALTE